MNGPWDDTSGSKSGRARALNCPSCGAPVVVRAAGLSVSVICGNCGSTLDATDPALGLIHQSHAALARPAIPLGTRGRWDDVEWEVVGYLERSGGGGHWQEYLLFNPWEGYRFLIHVPEQDGEDELWRLGQLLDSQPSEQGDRASFGGAGYEADEPYVARVDFVVGEFYWRDTVGEEVEARDYSAWGGGLSREANGAEVSWSLLRDLDAADVALAFGLQPPPEADAPADDGQWPHGRTLFITVIIAIAAMAALVIALIAKPSATLVAQNTFIVESGAPTVTNVIGPIEQRRSSSAIQVKATTNVDNAWVELDFALVERRTQQRYEASTTAEYYTGSDSDGRWSEGEPRPDVKFSGIPRGTYDLIVEAQARQWQQGSGYQGGYDVFGNARTPETPVGPPVAVTIAIVRDASFGSSFILATLAILIFPALLGWRHFARRQQRWRGR